MEKNSGELVGTQPLFCHSRALSPRRFVATSGIIAGFSPIGSFWTKDETGLRILFLLTQSLESPGGGGRFWPLAKALTQLGHEVTLVALHHDYAALSERRFRREGVDVWYVAQMHVIKVGNAKLYFSPWQLLWVTFWATVRLTWAALRTPCEVVLVCKTQPMNGVAAWVLALVATNPSFSG